MEIDETGDTVSSQSRTFKVARCCVRKRLEETDVTDAEWQISLHRGDPRTGQLAGGSGLVPVFTDGLREHLETVDGE